MSARTGAAANEQTNKQTNELHATAARKPPGGEMADQADSTPEGAQRGAPGPGADVGRGEPPVPAQMWVGGAPAVGALTRVVMAATTARCSRSVWSRHALPISYHGGTHGPVRAE